MVGAGLALRLWLAFDWYGLAGDIDNIRLVHTALDSGDPLGMYSQLNEGYAIQDYVALRWPYPVGFVPWIELSVLAENIGLPFHGTVSVLPILCEIGIGLAVYAYLGVRGAPEATRLIAAGLVFFGPSFFAVTGFHGQLDAAMVFPAVLALIAWERAPEDRRALWAGSLIGIGALVKWAPLFLVAALLPSARSWREATTLLVVPTLIVAIPMAPFALHDPDGVRTAFDYAGVPGGGGLSLIVQPGIASAYLEGNFAGLGDLNSANEFLRDNGSLITLAGLAGLAVFLARVRPAPLDAAVMTWLTIWVFNPSYALQYAIWGLPFLLLAGYLRWAALFQLVVLLPTMFWYDAFGLQAEGSTLHPLLMTVLWTLWVVGLVILARRLVLARRGQTDGVLEPLVRYGPDDAPTSAL